MTVAELKARHETDLSDTVLQDIIDGNEEYLNTHIGKATEETEINEGGSQEIILTRKSSGIQVIAETVGDDVTVLAADDYLFKADGLILKRLTTGTNPRSNWGEAEITYTPVSKIKLRNEILMKLCIMDIENSAYGRTTIGDVSLTAKDLLKEKVNLIRPLDENRIA